jgi:type IV pilus assembly protein PilV
MLATTPTSSSDDEGFTLVELMMAMLIMTVGLLGLLQSMNVAYEHSVRNRLREEALLLGEEQMGVLRRMSLSGDTPYRNISSAVKIVAGGAKKFTITRESQPMRTTRRLKVTVGWNFKNLSTSHSIYSLINM